MLTRYVITVALGSSMCLLAVPAFAQEHGDETNIFNADIGNFVFTLIIFGLVIVVLGKVAWRPLLKVLHERERTIRESLESAREEREQAERLLDEYKAQLDQARVEATAIVDEGRRDAEVVRQRILEEGRQQGAELLERARREIQLATDTAVKELYDQTAELSVKVAAGIIRKELSPKDHQELVAESLEEIKTTGKAKLN